MGILKQHQINFLNYRHKLKHLSYKFDPINPAPPVTIIFIFVILSYCVTFKLMGHQALKITRILVLILVLPVLTIFLSPLSKVSAECPSVVNQSIKVDNGLISAYDPAFFEAGENVSCVTGERATIQPFSILPYNDTDGSDSMIRNYFDQARSTFTRITLEGDQEQSTPSAVINLYSL